MAELSLKYKNFPKIPDDVTKFIKKSDIQKFCKGKALEVLLHSEKSLDRGQNVEGQPIRNKGYSESYRKYLTKVRKQGTTMDLSLSGQMRRSRKVKTTTYGARIEFTGTNIRRGGTKGRAVREVKPKNPGGSAGRQARADRGGGRGGGRRGRSSGGTPNVKIAQYLIDDMDFLNWHAISKADNKRINKEFSDLAHKMFLEYLKKNAISSK